MKRRAILLFTVCCQAIHVDATRLCARFRRHCGFCSAHIHARDHIRTFLLCLPGALGADDVTYSDVFLKHYPVRGREFDIANYALEAPSIIWDDLRERKVTVLRTRGDKYPYEEQKCVITVEGSGFETPRVLSAAHFRTVDVSWITGKLILIRLGIGHVAAVEAIYDTEKDSWVYRESVQYIKKVEPDGAANRSQPIRSETNSTSRAAGSGR